MKIKFIIEAECRPDVHPENHALLLAALLVMRLRKGEYGIEPDELTVTPARTRKAKPNANQ